MPFEVHLVDKDRSPIESNIQPIASQVINKSEPIVESENVVPQSVRSKILMRIGKMFKTPLKCGLNIRNTVKINRKKVNNVI